MSIKSLIQDGRGRGNIVRVDEDGAMAVVVHPHPPKDDIDAAFPFRQYFTDDGTATGSNDMRVNGSAAPIDFIVQSDPEINIYIKSVSVVIVDAGASLSEFGNLAALNNGVEFYWETQDQGIVTIADELQTNFDFVRLAIGEPSFGDGATAFTASNISGQSEGFLPVLDFQKIFGLQYGIKLRKGTKDRLFFRINDNITGIDEFNVIAYGIKF